MHDLPRWSEFRHFRVRSRRRCHPDAENWRRDGQGLCLRKKLARDCPEVSLVASLPMHSKPYMLFTSVHEWSGSSAAPAPGAVRTSNVGAFSSIMHSPLINFVETTMLFSPTSYTCSRKNHDSVYLICPWDIPRIDTGPSLCSGLKLCCYRRFCGHFLIGI